MPPRPHLQQLTKISGSILKNRVVYTNPFMLMHGVTEACNARCPYCVFRHGKRRPDELSFEEIAALYTEARAVGLQYLHLWGGEPLVHPRIGDIVREARTVGFVVGMVTNGSLLDRKHDEVVPFLDRLFVSVDHPSPRHDEMRRLPGLFDRIVAGVRRTRASSPKLPIVFTLTLGRDNADAMADMARLCRDLGVRLYVNPMRSGSVGESGGDHPNLDALEVDNASRVLDWDEQHPVWEELIALRRQGWPIQNTIHYMRQISRRRAAPAYRCHWPKLCLGVDANGDVVDCQDWARPVANVRDVPLKEILRSRRLRELRGRAGESCNACVTPGRVEPSWYWGLRPGVTSQVFENLVLKRADAISRPPRGAAPAPPEPSPPPRSPRTEAPRHTPPPAP